MESDLVLNKKNKKVKKESMLAEMSINIEKCQAILDDTSIDVSKVKKELLDDFKALPKQFYNPGAPEKFEKFLLYWGTHMVKSAKVGAKFTMINTMESTSDVTVDDFQTSSQKKFEDMTLVSNAKSTQTGSSSSYDVQDRLKMS